MRGCVHASERILETDREKGAAGYFSGSDKLSRRKGRPIVLKHVALENKPDISGTGISMAVLESIRSAVKIKVEGTSAPRQTLEVEKNQEHWTVRENKSPAIAAAAMTSLICRRYCIAFPIVPRRANNIVNSNGNGKMLIVRESLNNSDNKCGVTMKYNNDLYNNNARECTIIVA